MSANAPRAGAARRPAACALGSRGVTADYGLDAPGLVRSFAQMGGAAAAAVVLFAFLGAIAAVVLAALVAIPFLATAAAMVHSSRRGQLIERARLLDGLALRGDE